MKRERQLFIDDARFAISKPAGGGPAKLNGYPILWNALSTDRGGYKVRLKPGLARFADPCHALLHHDYRLLLGTTENGTLRFTVDDVGVRVDIDLPDTTVGRDCFELVDKKYVRGMSFAMVSSPQGVFTTEGGETILDVDAFTLDEVTVTAIPAFLQTTVGVTPPPAPAAAAFNRHSQAVRLEQFRFDLQLSPPAFAGY